MFWKELNLKPKIIAETSEWLAVSKPAGWHSVNLLTKNDPSLLSWAISQRPSLKNINGRDLLNPNKSPEYGLLHRLDQGTSGLMILAKTQEFFDRALKLWKTPKLIKTYRALCIGPKFKDLPQDIYAPIAHDAKTAKKMRVLWTPEAIKQKGLYRGKPLEAHTQVGLCHSLQEIQNGPEQNSLTWYLMDLEVQIFTGVQHQIRAHLSSVGRPLLFDPLYQKKREKDFCLSLPSLANSLKDPAYFRLHSWKISCQELGLALVDDSPSTHS